MYRVPPDRTWWPAVGAALERNVKDANGDENFKFKLVNGNVFIAIGFDFYANRYGAPSFSFYDNSSMLLTTISVAQSPSTLGFIGFTSTAPIAYVITKLDRGCIQNTGYDNLRTGSIPAVPEPQAAWLLMGGLLALVGVVRRRRRLILNG